MYQFLAFLKGLRRRWLVDKAEYKSYANPSNVGGWDGWYEHDGKCVAFRDVEGNLSLEW